MKDEQTRYVLRSPYVQWLASVLGLAFVYFWAARAGAIILSEHNMVSPFWPAAGVAVAGLVLGGPRLWPGILLGGIAADFMLSLPWEAKVVLCLGYVAEGLIGAIVYRRAQGLTALTPFTDVTAWALSGATACFGSALPGVIALWASDNIPSEAILTSSLTWLGGDALGIFITAPAAIAVYQAVRRGALRPSRKGIFRLLVTMVIAAAICSVIFYWTAGSAVLFLLFPIILIGTVWFGRPGAYVACLGVTLFCVFATGQTSGSSLASIDQSAAQFETFLFALSVTAHLLAVFAEIRCLGITSTVLLCGWLVGGWIFYVIENNRLTLDRFRLHNEITDTQKAMNERLNRYTDAMRGAVSLFASSESVTREEWHLFVRSLDLPRRFPGLNSIGVARPVRDRDLPAFLQQMSAGLSEPMKLQTVPDMPKPPADPAGIDHIVVVFAEAIIKRRNFLGFDFNSEARRAKAARKARDYGEARLTPPILLRNGMNRPGFILFVPLYNNDLPHDTVHERRMASVGWIYLPFAVEDFLRDILGARERLRFSLYQGIGTDPAKRFYSTFTTEPSRYEEVTSFQLAGQQFTAGWTRSENFSNTGEDPFANAATLALIPALLSGLVMSLRTTARQANELALQRTRELQQIADDLQRQITVREAAEQAAERAKAQAEAASAAKSEFLATMSHEIRTPMNGVLGYAELLCESPLTAEQMAWARNIETSGHTLLALINDILDFSKIEAGKLHLEAIPFDPLSAVREIIATMAHQARQKHLPLGLQHTPPLPEQVIGDPMRFKQVLINLVSNAIKFTEKGAVRVLVEWTPQGSRGTLRVLVNDTGLGIAQEKRDLLFRKFSQVDSSTTRRFGGTGLGLAICKTLIELMGGQIGVSSSMGVGTTVWFSIPFETTHPGGGEPSTEGGHAPGEETTPGHGRRVLLAEDVPVNQKLAGTILSRLGCEVDVARNGHEALEKALQGDYDLIFMDCQMPEMDGFEATRHIREQQPPDRPRTPIIAVTANAFAEDREKCLAAGMDDYISKPFSKEDFTRMLLRWK